MYFIIGSILVYELCVICVHLGEEVDLESTDANVVASLLKQYLRELPDSLVTSRLQERFEMITSEYPGLCLILIYIFVYKYYMILLNKYTGIQIHRQVAK